MENNWEEYRKKIIGLGDTSIKKSYYPELQAKISALEANQKNLSAIIDSISDSIVIHTVKGSLLSLNKKAEELLGIDNSKADAYSLIDFSNPELNPKDIIAKWNQAIKDTTMVFEWEVYQRGTAQVIDVQISVSPIIWNQKKVLVAVIRDFTERKKYEDNLLLARNAAKASEEKFRNIVELSPDGIFTISLHGTIMSVNRAFIELTGYPKEEFEGKYLLSIPTILKEDEANYKKLFERAVKGDLDKPFDLKWSTKSGKLKYGEARAATVAKGNDRFLQVVIRDVTESRKAQDKLRDSEERYDLALQAVNDGIWDWNLKTGYVYFDKRYYTIAGYSPNDFPHNLDEWKKRVHPDDLDVSLTEIEAKLHNDSVGFDVEFRFLRKDNTWMWIRGRGKVVEWDSEGNVVRIIGTHSDITDRKMLEFEIQRHQKDLEYLVKSRTEELEAANEELTSINEELYFQRAELEDTLGKLKNAQKQLVLAEKMASLGVLTSGIAHEINNPINFISSGVVGLEMEVNDLTSAIREYSRAFRALYPQDEIGLLHQIDAQYDVKSSMETIPKLIKSIRTGVDRTMSIVKGLRTFARLDDENKSVASLNELINSALTILYNKYKHSITITTSLCDDDEIYCFPGKLGQVFLNVLVNSIQAIEGQGTVEIQTTYLQDEQKYIISIKDSGKGIPSGLEQRIFDPFFTTKPVGEGTGLGLSIVHGIISDHNGEIRVNSREGKGTEFSIYLPKK
jgi:PAS domain S-box-containing protein